MKNLLLTLGHNSSAILIEDGELKWGYETERLTGVKSDSRFPLAVLEKMKVKPDCVYVSHWAPDILLSSMNAKHWAPGYFDGIPIRTLSHEFSHHDAHMMSAMCYAGPNFTSLRGVYALVIDGFGTMGEHFSVYQIDGLKPRLIKRVHGYDTSLGLWYQYATSFMGMKMNEDEYKMLGYETRVDNGQACKLDIDAAHYAVDWVQQMDSSIYGSRYDPVYSIDALANVRDKIYSHLTKVCDNYGIHDPTKPESRAILAFYVQAVLEHVVLAQIRELKLKYQARSFLLSGGVFYNVKLNKKIIELADGVVCVHPLAGDQGAAMGLYYHDNPKFLFPENLFWGQRTLKSTGTVRGLEVMNEENALDRVRHQLDTCGYVNLVRGAMEFGPRALCNTSTLALPRTDIVQRINQANNRNTVMPMAPVMRGEQLAHRYKDWLKIWRSHHHMIVALEYKDQPPLEEMGIAHEYKWPTSHWTSRPQLASDGDDFLDILLQEYGPLINTSFNFHGQPIAYDMDSIVDNHMMQHQRDSSFQTVVIKNDE